MRKVRITNKTFITPIQMDGPIVTPLPLSDSVIKELVRRGYTVIEKVDGEEMILNNRNVENPKAYLEGIRKTEETKPKPPKNNFEAPFDVIKVPEPKKIEPEPDVASEPIKYDFGNEVEMTDVTITDKPKEGIFLSGVSNNVEPTVGHDELNTIAESDASDVGEITDNTKNVNRINNKRKRHK